MLEESDANFDYNDPHVPKFHNELNDKHYSSVSLDKLEDYDAVVIVTNHTAYDYADIVKRAQLILDTRLACNGIKADNLVRM
ncbi:MAG: UDP binding domain-containing protein [Candidatus Cloacimonadales bacterium]